MFEAGKFLTCSSPFFPISYLSLLPRWEKIPYICKTYISFAVSIYTPANTFQLCLTTVLGFSFCWSKLHCIFCSASDAIATHSHSSCSLLCQAGKGDVEAAMVRVFSSGEQKQSAPSESCHHLSCRLLSHASSHLFTVMLDESSDSSNMRCYFELDAQVAEKDFFWQNIFAIFPLQKSAFILKF